MFDRYRGPARHIKRTVWPYVKRHKNDATDAEAICEAVTRPNMRLIASKIIELAQRGVRDAPTLTAMTLKEFKYY